MLSVEEKFLIENRVSDFAAAVIESAIAGDCSAATKNLRVFYEFLCKAFEAAKREGKMNAIAVSNSNN